MQANEAIVLVGGLGTRLRAVVSDVPKPLAPVAGRPFLEWLLDELAGRGIHRAILATGYLSGAVESCIGFEWQGMQITYSVEDSPLGTGGAIQQACAQLLHGDRGVHVLNGDTFLRYDPFALESATRARGTSIGVALAHVPDVGRYGAASWDGTRLTGFSEKGGSGPGMVNAGCYFLTGAAIVALPGRGSYSFETEVLSLAVTAGDVTGWPETSDFIDIGVPQDYAKAQDLFRRSA